MSPEQLYVVVRSVGERTEQACYDVAREQVGGSDQIRIVRGLPFAEAHFECIRLASRSAAKWALFLDADILLRSGALPDMVAEAEAFPEPFFMINFQVLDHGFGGPAYGTHLYAIHQLEKSTPFFDEVRNSQRPETALYFKVAQRGVPTFRSAAVMGIHGYEQYYRDLYRTAFVRAVKFGDSLGYFVQRYRFAFERSEQDGDREGAVLLAGLLDGLVHRQEEGSVTLEAGTFSQRAAEALSGLRLAEKGPLEIDQAGVDRILADHAPDDLYQRNQSWICPQPGRDTPPPEPRNRRAFKNRLRSWLLSSGVKAKRLIREYF